MQFCQNTVIIILIRIFLRFLEFFICLKEVGLLKKFFAVVLVIFCAAAVLMFASCNKTEDNEESTVDSNEDENGYIDTEAALADVQGI